MEKTRSSRSGKILRQPSGYHAFIPNPLPPQDPSIQIDSELQSLLSQADRFLGRLDGSIQTLPDPNLFVLMYVRKEAVLSSQIEGTQSSLRDVLEAEARLHDPARPDDAWEVINYVNALNRGLDLLAEIPISIRLMKELHQMLLHNVRGSERDTGDTRTSQNWIGPPGCSLADAIFVPPPPNEMQEALSDLERFVNTPTNLPLLIQIGMAHAQFETIHPFLDGNGRLGRLLITLLLCEREVLLEPVLYLSHYFKENREEYYDLLQAIRIDGDWESWLKFFLRGVTSVSKEATKTARLIVDLREEDRTTINSTFGRTAANAHNVLEYVYSRPIINVQTVREITGVSYPAAYQLIERFQDCDILEEITGRTRNRLYKYTRYIQLFS